MAFVVSFSFIWRAWALYLILGDRAVLWSKGTIRKRSAELLFVPVGNSDVTRSKKALPAFFRWAASWERGGRKSIHIICRIFYFVGTSSLKNLFHNVFVEAGSPSSPVYSVYAGRVVNTVLQNCLMNVLDLNKPSLHKKSWDSWENVLRYVRVLVIWCCLQSILFKQCSADWIWGRKHLWCPKAGEVLFPESGKQIKKLMLYLRETFILETVLEIWLLHFKIFFPPGLHITLLLLIKFETEAILIFLARFSL